MKRPARYPGTIPTSLPGTGPLDVAPSPATQLAQARDWYDRRIAAADRSGGERVSDLAAALGVPDPSDIVVDLGRRRRRRSGGAFGSWVVVAGSPDARTAVVFATAAALDEAAEYGLTKAIELGARVVVPSFVRRERRGELCRRLGKDRRHLLHRLAFPLGHTLTGLEAGVLVATVLELRDHGLRVVLAGRDDGVRAALVATRLLREMHPGIELELVVTDPAAVVGPIEGGPIDRLIHDEASVGGPARWAANPDARPTVVASPEDLWRPVLRAIAPQPRGTRPTGAFEEPLRQHADATFRSWLATLRARTDAADRGRAARAGIDRRPPAGREAAAARLRAVLATSVEGRSAVPDVHRGAARTRLLRVTDRFVAYEIELDTGSGPPAWGHVLIPRGTRAAISAIVAQHGLDGTPADVTGVGHDDLVVRGDAPAPYHAFGARLAERGHVVVAPYLTVPEPQDSLINPLVARATYLGEQRTRLELIKLRAIIDWLASQPFVDAARIGYYGLSYGGHAALWMAGLEPRITAVVVSGHFNDWTAKTAALDDERSFLAHPDEDFTVWRAASELSHPELLAAAWPRSTLIEAGSDDPITTPGWFGRGRAAVEDWAARWGTPDVVAFDTFDGIHEVTGAASFEFLDRHLRPKRAFARDFEYRLDPGRDLPGIGDTSPDNDPFIAETVPVEAALDIAIPMRRGATFRGVAVRLSRSGEPSDLDRVVIDYRTAAGTSLGSATINGSAVHALWDLWYDAPIPPVRVTSDVVAAIRPRGSRSGGVVVYGPRSLAPRDRRLRPAIRLLTGASRPRPEPTHGFARAMLDDASSEFRWQEGTDRRTTWRIEDRPSGDIAEVAVGWLREAMDPIGPEVAVSADLTIGFRHVDSLPGGPRSHRVTVDRHSIVLESSSERGWLAAVGSLRDRIASDRSLANGTVERIERVRDRVTTGVMPAGTRYLEADLPSAWSDGLLDRVARSGFTGIWTWLNLEDATVESAAIPDLADSASAARLARLDRLTSQAARFGLDVWVYLASSYRRPPQASFWAAHPELRGGDGWLGPTFCTSTPTVAAYHREVVSDIVRRAPSIAGMFVIFDMEGFYFCGSEEEARLACARCRERSSEVLAHEVLANLDGAIRSVGGRHRLIAWSYGWRPDWVERLIPTLPASVEVQADFTKGALIRRGGVTIPAGDYTIAEVGPSPVFERLREAGRDRPFWVKTEHAISLDAIFVPFIPALDQFAARAAAVRAAEPVGWFANWQHYGFLVPHPALLLNRFAFDPVPDADDALDELAAGRFGRGAVPSIRRAWAAFSEAARAFPYSDPVARSPGPFQKGPTQPLWLDRDLPAAGSWRSWQNALAWTAPWGPRIARASLVAAARAYRRGLADLRGAIPRTTGLDRDRLGDDIGVARVLLASLETMIAHIDWVTVRDATVSGSAANSRDRSDRLRTIAQHQRRRAVAIITALEADSRLGFAQDGGGVVRGGLFNPALLRRSVGLLDDLLARDLAGRDGEASSVPWFLG
jgi:dienelactone hydrolase